MASISALSLELAGWVGAPLRIATFITESELCLQKWLLRVRYELLIPSCLGPPPPPPHTQRQWGSIQSHQRRLSEEETFQVKTEGSWGKATWICGTIRSWVASWHHPWQTSGPAPLTVLSSRKRRQGSGAKAPPKPPTHCVYSLFPSSGRSSHSHLYPESCFQLKHACNSSLVIFLS